MVKLAMGMKQVVVVAWFTSIFIPWKPATSACRSRGRRLPRQCLVDFRLRRARNSVSRSRFKVLGNQTWAVVTSRSSRFVFVVVGV